MPEFLEDRNSGNERMAPWLRTLAALEEALGLVPVICMEAHYHL